MKATELYFNNAFGGLQERINELGDYFGHGDVYEAMKEPNQMNDAFISEDMELSRFERIKLDVFLVAAKENLYEREIDIYDLDVKIGAVGMQFQAQGLKGLGLEEMAKKVRITLVDKLGNPNDI